MFVLTIGLLGPVPVMSLVCIRSSAAYIWPLYTVEMWARGPPTRHHERNKWRCQPRHLVACCLAPSRLRSSHLSSRCRRHTWSVLDCPGICDSTFT
jgi:hypothetical protein